MCRRCQTFQHTACAGRSVRPGQNHELRPPYYCYRCAPEMPPVDTSADTLEYDEEEDEAVEDMEVEDDEESPAKKKKKKKKKSVAGENAGEEKKKKKKSEGKKRKKEEGEEAGTSAAAKKKKKSGGKKATTSDPFGFVAVKEVREAMKQDWEEGGGPGNKRAKRDSVVARGARQPTGRERALIGKYAVMIAVATDDADRAAVFRGLCVLLRCTERAATEALGRVVAEVAAPEPAPPRPDVQPFEAVPGAVWDTEESRVLTELIRPVGSEAPPGPYRPASEVAVRAVQTPAGERQALFVTAPVLRGQFIVEYAGRLVPPTVAEEAWAPLPAAESAGVALPLVARPAPFLLVYPKFSRPAVCIDARAQGNAARVVRRSCRPTADVRPFVPEGRPDAIGIGLFAARDLPADTEVTIQFDFPWQAMRTPVVCACAAEDCPVSSWFSVRATALPGLGAKLDSLFKEEERAPSPPPPSSPPQQPRSSSGVKEEAAAAASPSQGKGLKKRPSVVAQLETTLEWAKPKNKPTREERKLAAIMQTFEKLEHREARKRKTVQKPPGEEGQTPRSKRRNTEEKPQQPAAEEKATGVEMGVPPAAAPDVAAAAAKEVKKPVVEEDDEVRVKDESDEELEDVGNESFAPAAPGPLPPPPPAPVVQTVPAAPPPMLSSPPPPPAAVVAPALPLPAPQPLPSVSMEVTPPLPAAISSPSIAPPPTQGDQQKAAPPRSVKKAWIEEYQRTQQRDGSSPGMPAAVIGSPKKQP